jgi:serine/threonine-protein kinase
VSTDPRWARLEALFDGALARPADAREAWLAVECADDPALGDEVRRMLAAHRRPGGILDAAPPPAPSPAPGELARRAAAALAGRYDIERELGRGGSATVFLAHERKHGRRVVLKVLEPFVARLWGPERFAREVRIAARLSHPHIVGLLDSGADADLYWYVMPYVEGESLRDKLRLGPLSQAEALGLLRDVAGALAFAHAAGVVHRDLKPENVLVSGQHGYLLDFGVAKLLPTHAGDDHVSSQGTAVGTLAYMAPEQLRADPTADHRVDIYAWGLVAWEMLAGRLPPVRTLDAAGSPGTLQDAAPGVAPELAALVARCLAPEPAARPGSAELLLDALDALAGRTAAGRQGGRAAVRHDRTTARRLGGVAAAVAAAAAAGWFLFGRGTPAAPGGITAPPGIGVPAPIAVAALVNETGDPSLDTWGRMAGDWLTQGLQATNLLPVVPWPSSLEASERLAGERRAGRPASALDLFRDETGARTVVSGAYYLVGDSLQFRVEVTDAVTGRALGSLPPIAVGRDSAHVGIRALRDRVMGTIAIWFDERLAPSTAVLAQMPPTYDAYQLFDRGLRRFNAQDYRGALPEFLEAIRLDSTWAAPVLYAASAASNSGRDRIVDSLLRSLEGRQKALGESERWYAEAMRHELAGDGDAAREAYRRSAELSSSGREWYNFARVALQTGRPEEALEALLHADPDRGLLRGWSSYWTQMAHAYHLLGRHEEELAAARALRGRFPDRHVGLTLEVRALAALGRAGTIDSALATADDLPPLTYWSRAAALVVAGEELWAHGHEAEGRVLLERALEWLAAQRAAYPEFDAHRFWEADALYALGRWAEAESLFAGLARDFSGSVENLQYRGSAALAAAHRGDPAAERRLGEPLPRERGEHAIYRARLAAIRGDASQASALFSAAVRDGVSGLAWIHAYLRPDLEGLDPGRLVLPTALRVAGPAR